ncbi:hypothetical protein [Alicyclobacillus dauci]|uniref:Asp23 family, cell envelope-related function n=1 Tax=Alicyclobacillus dauci TaxID=1475485 RepID=A0ABY6Z351_9BACL|nr:hypothetical protein [Alicyclobacillus dauci]WAH37277.1 hypothetical protein NZD86_01630 [Alicyclobacillus dauci]
MVEMLQVQIKHPGIALTKTEQRLIECLVMRICVHHLYRRVAKPFRIRPARVDSIHLVVNQDVIVEEGLTEEEAHVIMRDLENDIRHTLDLCELSTEEVVLTAKA